MRNKNIGQESKIRYRLCGLWEGYNVCAWNRKAGQDIRWWGIGEQENGAIWKRRVGIRQHDGNVEEIRVWGIRTVGSQCWGEIGEYLEVLAVAVRRKDEYEARLGGEEFTSKI